MYKPSLINWRECPLPTRSCLEEQKADRLSRPGFSPADGVLVLLSTQSIAYWEKSFYSHHKQHICLLNKTPFFLMWEFHSLATKTNYHFINLVKEMLSSWWINSENKLRAYNRVLVVLELILVSWCIIFHPASELVSCQSLPWNQLVLMALPLHRLPLWWWR